MGPTLDQHSANPFAEESAAVVGRRIKSIFGGSIGNLIEWYDFYVYNSFAIYFAKSFSSSADPTVQLITTFGIYAVGFFIRPVGGLLLGYYSDRAGRRAGLTVSVVLMCLGSLMIAVLPTYATVGIWAPVLLLLARLLQGLSLGGEYASSATYLSEVAGAKHRGFYSSFQYVTLIGGQVLAALVLLVMQQGFDSAQLSAWAWRIPFAIGALGSLYGFYLRRNLVESEEWTQAAREPRRNLLRELFQHPRELLLVFGLTMGGTTAFYTFSSYMPTYLANTLKFPKEWVAEISFISLLLFAAMQPLFGALSDWIGRRPVLMWFGVMGTLCTVPILSTLETTHGYMQALVLVLAAFLIVSGYTSINAVVKAELFPAGVRALGVGLPYALAASLFGGTAPLIALQFKDGGHESWFYWYVTGLTFLSLLVYALMRDTKKASRIVN
jgi:MHS family alpha-ketoglutarate permease-like MFS transporter